MPGLRNWARKGKRGKVQAAVVLVEVGGVLSHDSRLGAGAVAVGLGDG